MNASHVLCIKLPRASPVPQNSRARPSVVGYHRGKNEMEDHVWIAMLWSTRHTSSSLFPRRGSPELDVFTRFFWGQQGYYHSIGWSL